MFDLASGGRQSPDSRFKTKNQGTDVPRSPNTRPFSTNMLRVAVFGFAPGLQPRYNLNVVSVGPCRPYCVEGLTRVCETVQ